MTKCYGNQGIFFEITHGQRRSHNGKKNYVELNDKT